MDKTLYQFLKTTAIVVGVVVIGLMVWDSFFDEKIPGNFDFQQGNTFFEDQEYLQALRHYEKALVNQPDSPDYARAKARTLMQLGRNDEALAWYDQAIELRPYFGGTYANRGILHDRMGRYELAISDYDKAVQLDEKIIEGPHWLTRFLRNQPENPPNIKQRADYLRQELKKPAEQRTLRIPEIDAKQRSYKQR